MLTVIALISLFLIADDGGDFTVPAQRTQGVQCAGCLDIWDGKGQFVDMIWKSVHDPGPSRTSIHLSQNPVIQDPQLFR